MDEALVREARGVFGEDVSENESLAKHCSFGVGGPGRLFVRAREISTLRDALGFGGERRVPFVVLGRGTNVLIPDSGFGGMVISVEAHAVQFDGNRIVAQAGASLRKVARLAAERGLTGLEFSAGIPGSIGGAVMMNAGAHGRSIGELIEEVSGFDASGQELRFRREDLRFAYRESNLKELARIVTNVALVLHPGEHRAIKETMERLLRLRRSTQPVRARSAGSVFKNPPGDSAGRLIELAECKGLRRGGALVSRKHANYIVNRGGATYSDIRALIEIVRERVRKVHGVELELEIIDVACSNAARETSAYFCGHARIR